MKIVINGLGIAGATLAYWLHRFGHEPTLVEQASRLRRGGYAVDFWGVGYDIADKMGLIPGLRENGYFIEQVRWVNGKGKTSSTLDLDAFRELAHDRYVTVERAELAAAIYETLDESVETIFGDSIAAIKKTPDSVHVGFEHARPRDFDLVVGADGLHSRVRELVFGPIKQFETDLGLRFAAFEIQGYTPRDEDVFVIHWVPGRQISRLSKHNDSTLVLLGFHERFEHNGFPTTDEQPPSSTGSRRMWELVTKTEYVPRDLGFLVSP